MAALSYARVKLSGTDHALTAADPAGDTIAPHERGFLHVVNGSASPVTVTVVTPGSTEFGVDQPDVDVVVAAGAASLVGPLSGSLVNKTDKAIRVSYSATASVTRAAAYI